MLDTLRRAPAAPRHRRRHAERRQPAEGAVRQVAARQAAPADPRRADPGRRRRRPRGAARGHPPGRPGGRGRPATVSSEVEDLAAVCDRVLVLEDGVVARELTAPFTPDAVLAAIFTASTHRREPHDHRRHRRPDHRRPSPAEPAARRSPRRSLLERYSLVVHLARHGRRRSSSLADVPAEQLPPGHLRPADPPGLPRHGRGRDDGRRRVRPLLPLHLRPVRRPRPRAGRPARLVLPGRRARRRSRSGLLFGAVNALARRARRHQLGHRRPSASAASPSVWPGWLSQETSVSGLDFTLSNIALARVARAADDLLVRRRPGRRLRLHHERSRRWAGTSSSSAPTARSPDWPASR